MIWRNSRPSFFAPLPPNIRGWGSYFRLLWRRKANKITKSSIIWSTYLAWWTFIFNITCSEILKLLPNGHVRTTRDVQSCKRLSRESMLWKTTISSINRDWYRRILAILWYWCFNRSHTRILIVVACVAILYRSAIA